MDGVVSGLVRLSKQDLFDRAGDGLIAQSGGEIVDDTFVMPSIEMSVAGPLPSIETFVVSRTGEISAMGTKEALNAAWMPTIERLVAGVHAWVEAAAVELTGDAYVTASLTAASNVNGEAHFDDGQFEPTAGAGLVAIVGDLDGPSVASEPIPHDDVRPNQPLADDNEMKMAFDEGDFGRIDFAPNELIVMPQFGQLHSGPGPCGAATNVRHLLVFRSATAPTRDL